MTDDATTRQLTVEDVDPYKAGFPKPEEQATGLALNPNASDRPGSSGAAGGEAIDGRNNTSSFDYDDSGLKK